jgi:Mlc titration factor MtfA (ptsG expression regulator)
MTNNNNKHSLFFTMSVTLVTFFACIGIYYTILNELNLIWLPPIYAVTSLFIVYTVFNKTSKQYRSRQIAVTEDFPNNWRTILNQNVIFYKNLDNTEKENFENRINLFINEKKITGINTKVDDKDKLLVASSAIIPIFSFKNWEYSNLDEVLLYPSSFNSRYETQGADNNITGMVGSGVMEGKMILSKPALHLGFNNISDKKNVGIHEFVHLIDKADGVIDGIPSALTDHQYAIPWIDLVYYEIEKIFAGKSDINPYGGTNNAEFLSVICEYFFERPTLLKQKHPDLYKLLEQIFNQDMAGFLKNRLKSIKTNRNAQCPCGSGKKFKKCCGRN